MSFEKPFKPKSRFQRIFEVHSDWLFQQGYHERALGSLEKPGRILKDLRECFSQAIDQTKWEYRIEEFDIGTRGVFGAKKDPVDFIFHYAYDPDRVRLQLTQLSARLFEETIDYLIDNDKRRQLPPADTVHAQLAAVINAQLLERLKEKTNRTNHKPRLR